MEFLPSGKTVDTYEISGALLNDLTVIEIPKEALTNKKDSKKNSVKTPKQQIKDDAIVFQLAEPLKQTTPPKNQPQPLMDDAILFAKPAKTDSPKPKKSKGRKNTDEAWSDNVGQIKKGEDFDFATNLKLFDKASVFKDLKAKDRISLADRLAGHNISPKVNYDHTEMVSAKTADNWEDEEAAEKSKSNSQLSKTTTKTKPKQSSVLSPSNQTDFRFLISTGPLLLSSPAQLLDIEKIATETFNIPDYVLCENSSIGIARLALGRLGGTSRLSNSHNTAPLILILAGNNRAGARALAAGRHLANRGVRVMAYIFCEDEPEETDGDVFYDARELDEDVSNQGQLLTNCGGKMYHSLENVIKAIDQLDLPLELVLDGLQGSHSSVSDYWGASLKKFLEIVGWVNHQRVQILSLDIPSGLDAGLGRSPLTQGDIESSAPELQVGPEDAWVQANVVISCGLPLVGLLQAYRLGVVEHGDWEHYIVDMGIPRKAYSTKGLLKRFDKAYFGDDWFVEVEVKPVEK